ncbi:MAG: ABC-F family ATP-binding cassette domain-containing protein [Pseudomonadota bacterium]
MLHINDLNYNIAGRPLFKGATLAIPDGWRVGLIGRNGTGKSTLLRLITGEISPDAGSLNITPGARIGVVAQEAPTGETSLLDTVLAADTERAALLAEAETATDPDRIGIIHTRLADISAHTAPARAGAILKGLGFDAAQQAQPCSAFSGGWRMRVALGAVLFSEPDLLLLDEPTNYLDLEGAIWLESYLRSYPRTVILVSHDRDLLNTAVQYIVHLDEGRLNMYTGGYDQFEEVRRLKLDQQLSMKAKQDHQRKHLQAFVDRFRYTASKARQAQSRLKALARMQPIAAVSESQVLPFDFPKPEHLAPPLISIEDGEVGYVPGKPVLRKLNLRFDMEDRIALLGANGNGKSTFAKLLTGKLKLERGQMRMSKKLRIGYLAQHQIDELDGRRTPFDHFQDAMPENSTEAQIRNKLGGFGFGFLKAATKVDDLSGGEKTRLLFALITLPKPHLMILDEPTNHLDVDSREALAQALNEYEGAVILISHDRHLIDACAERLWLVKDGTVASYEGSLEEYSQSLLQGGRASAPKLATARDKDKDAPAKQDTRRTGAQKRNGVAPLKQAVADAEKKLAELNTLNSRIEEALSRPGLYTDAPERAQKLIKQKADLARLITAAEERWLSAQQAYEEAMVEA